MANYYPPVSFHFKVEVLGLSPISNDVRFTEVSGLSVEMGTEEVPEGGENRFIQKYPTQAKYPELVLKRGLLLNSEIVNWVRECIEDYRIQPKNIDIKLLNEPAAGNLASGQRLSDQMVGQRPECRQQRGLDRNSAAVLSIFHRGQGLTHAGYYR